MRNTIGYEVRVRVPHKEDGSPSTVLWFNFVPTYEELLGPLAGEIKKVNSGRPSDRVHHQIDFIREMARRGEALTVGSMSLVIAGTFVGGVDVTEYEVWARNTEPEDLPAEAFPTEPFPTIHDGRPCPPTRAAEEDNDIPF